MQSKTILVIEDDRTIRNTIKLILELEGYKVLLAADGREGLNLLSDVPAPCLILLDLMMPVMTGWEFIEALEADQVLMAIPVVVVTAFSEKAEKVKSERKVIKKPLEFDTLLAVANEYCR